MSSSLGCVTQANSSEPRVLVASDYEIDHHVWNGMIYEMATLTAGFHGTRVLNAVGRSPKDFIFDRLHRRKLPAEDLADVDDAPYDLFFYVCNFPSALTAMRSLDKAKRRAKKSVAFIIETWSAKLEAFKASLKLLDSFDHVFICNETSLPAVQSVTRTPCSYLPAAIDTLLACSYPRPPERIIDVFAMGRCDERIHEDLKKQAQRGELFYFFENFGGLKVRTFEEARARTYDLINRSKIFLCFNHDSGAKALESKGEAAIPNRIFEGLPAGGVLAGTAPRTKSFDPVFNWEDCFIETPLDPAGFRTVVRDLLADRTRLHNAALRNMAQSLRRLDWVYRWEDILATLGMVPTQTMLDRKDKLASMATLIERDYVPSGTPMRQAAG